MRLNSYRYENDLSIANDINLKKNYGCKSEQIPSSRNSNFTHKVLDSLNLSIIILIIILSYLSFESQRKWTNYYSAIQVIRKINSNLIDYSSQAEEFYLTEIDSLEDFRITTTKDLIYLSMPLLSNERGFIEDSLKQIREGLKEGFYQRGY